jgi:hypothetical protein
MITRRRVLSLAATARGADQLPEKWNPEIKGQKQNILQQAGALFDAIVCQVRFALLNGDDGRNIFQKIHAALFAFAALALLVAACGTLVTQRGVAALAESRDVTSLGIAFRALHGSILAGSGDRVRARESRCAHVVNMAFRAGGENRLSVLE